MTFIQWLNEQKTDGNYVALKCSDLSGIWKRLGLPRPETGEPPPNTDYHCTLIFSPTSVINPKTVQKELESEFGKIELDVNIIGAAVFHSTAKNGERDENKACVVLKLAQENLEPIHEFLQTLGLTHTYEDYSPHVSLVYNMDADEAEKYKRWINAKVKGLQVRLDQVYSEKINKDYV